MSKNNSIYILGGVTAFLFSCTGPVAIIISVALSGGLSDQHVASWLFGGFAITGVYTLYYSFRYRQPLSFAWTIPGTVLLISALNHLSFEEVVGAYFATAGLIFLIGYTCWVQWIMDSIPKPVVMAMVAGVFLDFGLNLVDAFNDSLPIAISMVAAFLMLSVMPNLQRLVPPILGALVVGILVVIVTDSFKESDPLGAWLMSPLFFMPAFSLKAMIELVIPLTITVVVVQNGQGFAVIKNAGHAPPINSMTKACGTGSVLLALVGSVTMCVTGPANAILASVGKREHQYIGGVTYGVLAVAFGIFSSSMTWFALKLPASYIAVLGGLAVLKVLQGAFVSAFGGKYSMGALVTFLVTVSGISMFNISAPFWALVMGASVSWLLERSE
ncbi:MAG: benzoate transporter [Gammaproteobacteria bacterium]|nr:benzoate transporter [Gammaproteobacteria bacterium]NKB63596.1 benzoate transporter [Gammaproteobacteria bacterium]NKB64513.1 benzoate transporter [Gammaproteobacteria bacterium]